MPTVLRQLPCGRLCRKAWTQRRSSRTAAGWPRQPSQQLCCCLQEQLPQFSWLPVLVPRHGRSRQTISALTLTAPSTWQDSASTLVQAQRRATTSVSLSALDGGPRDTISLHPASSPRSVPLLCFGRLMGIRVTLRTAGEAASSRTACDVQCALQVYLQAPTKLALFCIA